MDQPVHPLKELFEQLGLPADAEAINRFIAMHSPLPENITLANAPFWTPAQAAFLREEFVEDADWIETIDRLNVALRAKQA